ncbi:MAG: hypothetical protein K6T65_01485 [Peptococcaceae bacterium]|nr:hypothetical protein [Peptococcaceae bacterium]
MMFGPEAATDLKNIRLILFEKEIEKGVPATKAECWIAQKATCAHEAGHIKFTSSGVWEKAVKFGGRQMTILLNIVEDARIERCMANAYPGTLMWFRFLNDYIFTNRRDWGAGPKALIGGLISYALVGRIPEPIQAQEDVMELIEKCAPYINVGRLEKDTEGAYECAKKIWDVIKDYIGSFTPPVSLPHVLGTKKPEKAPKGTLDPRREPKPIKKPEEITSEATELGKSEKEYFEVEPSPEGKETKPETEDREPRDSGDRESGEKPEKPSESSEAFEESKDSKECEKTGFDEKPEGKSDKSTDHEKEEAKGTGDKDSSSDSCAEEEGEAKEAGDEDSSDIGDDGHDDHHEDAGDKSTDSAPSEGIEEPGFEHEESKPEDDPEGELEEYPEDDPEEYPEDDLEEGSEEFPGDEDFDDESLPEPPDEDPFESGDESWGTDESAPDSSKDGGTLPAGMPGESGSFGGGESIDMGDYTELLESADDELSTIEEAASRASKSEMVDFPDISAEEITGELSKGINEGVIFTLKKDLRVDDHTRKAYEKIYSEVKGYVNKTVFEIRKILEYKATVKERNLRKGALDNGSLWKLHVKDPKVFYRINEPNDIPKLAVYLLVDCSGSMSRMGKEVQARKSACLLYEVCQQLKIPVNVTGFTGEVYGKNDVTHYRLVAFDDKPEKKYALPHLKAISENRDGYSIRVATRELLLRNEDQKVLIVLSDGMPMMPYRHYYGAAGEKDTALAVREAEKKQVGVIGLFFGDSYELPRAQRIYNNLIFVKDVEVLPLVLARVLKKVVSNL